MLATRIAVIASLAAAGAIASAQGVPIGPRVGVFIPSDERLRNAFGDTWVSIGLGGVNPAANSDSRKGFDWATTTQSKNGNKIFLGAASWGASIPLSGGDEGGPFRRQSSSGFRTYAAARAGLSYIDYAFTEGATRISGKRLGWNANVELGAYIGPNFSLAARYDLNPSYDGTRFSGLFLEANFTVARF